MQPKVKFLTVVWGETYIERFCALSLPSFLAPGNLPALARATELEVVIMTRRNDFEYFEKNISFKRLKAICPIRFVEIDDLITTAVYGVTLTLAYARPIIACGSEMLHTHFVFMNADFVLADGSLQSLCKHIMDGRSIVLGPSYRAIAEEIEPKLESAVEAASGILSIPPRQLVELSLKHPHRTTVAKTNNQNFFHSSHPNQFFWQVDEHTTLGRYFLIFMLCIKPERVIETINCFCDYSFIPEFCPSGNETVMGDSDDFFMLELQNRGQETHMLRHGHQSYSQIARSLQEWTTAEHRRAASYDIIFHSNNIPPEIEAAKIKANSFIGSIKQKLGPPKPHVNHRYWVSGVDAWKHYREMEGLSATSTELAPCTEDIFFKLRRMRHRLARLVKPYLHTVRRFIECDQSSNSVFSPYWRNSRLLRNVTDSILANPNPTLVVGNRGDKLSQILNAHPAITFVREKDFLRDKALLTIFKKEYSQILICPSSTNIEAVQKLIERGLSIMFHNGNMHIVFSPSASISSDRDLSNLTLTLGDIFGNHAKELSIQSVGGRLAFISLKLNAMLLRKVVYYYQFVGPLVAIFSIASLVFLVPFTVAVNIFSSLRKDKARFVGHCSSFVIHAQLWDGKSD